ncbi:hypothetical protein MMC11_006952 [Xylographa trunciseda]|nr:hypothetical protein [Xylographa trunciseda]
MAPAGTNDTATRRSLVETTMSNQGHDEEGFVPDHEEYPPASEMSTLLEEMLESLTTKVDQVGEEINTKLDEMSRRLDNLEASILSQTKEEPQTTS